MRALEIIYEDKDIVACNKPPGVLFDWALEERKDLIIVHRLDRETSGVILFAKNTSVAEAIKFLFQTHQIHKTYLALVVGNVKADKGVIDLPIGRSKRSPILRVAKGEQRGKIREALTEYKVLKRFPAVSESNYVEKIQFTLVEVYPKTGRTHQIRSHFSAIGHPIVCDGLYAGKKKICPAGLVHHFLHSLSIDLTLPSGGRIKLEADLPDDLEKVLATV